MLIGEHATRCVACCPEHPIHEKDGQGVFSSAMDLFLAGTCSVVCRSCACPDSKLNRRLLHGSHNRLPLSENLRGATAEEEQGHFIKCSACGRWVDMHNLNVVLEHDRASDGTTRSSYSPIAGQNGTRRGGSIKVRGDLQEDKP